MAGAVHLRPKRFFIPYSQIYKQDGTNEQNKCSYFLSDELDLVFLIKSTKKETKTNETHNF